MKKSKLLAKNKLNDIVNEAYEKILAKILAEQNISTIDDYAQLVLNDEIQRIYQFYLKGSTIEDVAKNRFNSDIQKEYEKLGDPMLKAKMRFNQDVEDAAKLFGSPTSPPFSREPSRTRTGAGIPKKLNLDIPSIESPEKKEASTVYENQDENSSTSEGSKNSSSEDFSELVQMAKTVDITNLGPLTTPKNTLNQEPEKDNN